MRLFELDDPQTITRKKDILVSLLNLVRTKAQNRNSNIKMPFTSLQKLMHNVGFDITYQEFEHLINKDPAIDQFVDEHDPDYLVIGKSSTSADDMPDDDLGGGMDDDLGDLGGDLGTNDPAAFAGQQPMNPQGQQGMPGQGLPGMQQGQGLPGLGMGGDPMQGDPVNPIDTSIVKNMAKRATQRRGN